MPEWAQALRRRGPSTDAAIMSPMVVSECATSFAAARGPSLSLIRFKKFALSKAKR
jgi:hypothetical protein